MEALSTQAWMLALVVIESGTRTPGLCRRSRQSGPGHSRSQPNFTDTDIGGIIVQVLIIYDFRKTTLPTLGGNPVSLEFVYKRQTNPRVNNKDHTRIKNTLQ